jgi:hypothetical protein
MSATKLSDKIQRAIDHVYTVTRELKEEYLADALKLEKHAKYNEDNCEGCARYGELLDLYEKRANEANVECSHTGCTSGLNATVCQECVDGLLSDARVQGRSDVRPPAAIAGVVKELQRRVDEATGTTVDFHVDSVRYVISQLRAALKQGEYPCPDCSEAKQCDTCTAFRWAKPTPEPADGERPSTITPEDVQVALDKPTDPTLRENLDRTFRTAPPNVRLRGNKPAPEPEGGEPACHAIMPPRHDDIMAECHSIMPPADSETLDDMALHTEPEGGELLPSSVNKHPEALVDFRNTLFLVSQGDGERAATAQWFLECFDNLRPALPRRSAEVAEVYRAAELARDALDRLIGDSDLDDDTSIEFRAMQALSAALDGSDKLAGSAPAEPGPDTLERVQRLEDLFVGYYRRNEGMGSLDIAAGKFGDWAAEMRAIRTELGMAEPSPDAGELADRMERLPTTAKMNSGTEGAIRAFAAEVRRLQPDAKAPASKTGLVYLVVTDDGVKSAHSSSAYAHLAAGRIVDLAPTVQPIVVHGAAEGECNDCRAWQERARSAKEARRQANAARDAARTKLEALQKEYAPLCRLLNRLQGHVAGERPADVAVRTITMLQSELRAERQAHEETRARVDLLETAIGNVLNRKHDGTAREYLAVVMDGTSDLIRGEYNEALAELEKTRKRMAELETHLNPTPNPGPPEPPRQSGCHPFSPPGVHWGGSRADVTASHHDPGSGSTRPPHPKPRGEK